MPLVLPSIEAARAELGELVSRPGWPFGGRVDLFEVARSVGTRVAIEECVLPVPKTDTTVVRTAQRSNFDADAWAHWVSAPSLAAFEALDQVTSLPLWTA